MALSLLESPDGLRWAKKWCYVMMFVGDRIYQTGAMKRLQPATKPLLPIPAAFYCLDHDGVYRLELLSWDCCSLCVTRPIRIT